jgi:hypothetical protein
MGSQEIGHRSPTDSQRVRVTRYMRYSTAAEGAALTAPLVGTRHRPAPGRRRFPVGMIHAVPWWAPGHTLCGRATTCLALFPTADFETQRIQLCQRCVVAVQAEFADEAGRPAHRSS